MKAIYEIEFLTKRDPSLVNDRRRLVADASAKGFKKMMDWALSVSDPDEFVGSIKIVACEKP